MMRHETVTVDTYAAVKALMAADFDEKQAEAVVNTIKEINLSHLATKADIQEVKGEIEIVRKDMEILKRDLTIRMWTVGAANAGIVLAALKYFIN